MSHHLMTAAAFALALAAPQFAAAQEAAPAAPTAAPAPAAAPAAKVVAAGDLVETARASGQFTTFIKALDATNLTNLLKQAKGLTVFAPTDAAFAALPPGQLDKLMADKAALQKLLTHHVINAQVDSSKIAGKKGPVMTVANDPMELDGSEGLKVDNATIVQADIRATNGVLHVVDKVLTPMPPMAPTASAAPAPGAATTATN